jgi:hypothetical protein
MPDSDYFSPEKGEGGGTMVLLYCCTAVYQHTAAVLLHQYVRQQLTSQILDTSAACWPISTHAPSPLIPCLASAPLCPSALCPTTRCIAGDALYAFEVALALEKLRMDRLKALHSLADATDDFQVGVW